MSLDAFLRPPPQIPMQRQLPHVPTPPGHPATTGPLPAGAPPGMPGQAAAPPDPFQVNTAQLVAQLLERLALQAQGPAATSGFPGPQ